MTANDFGQNPTEHLRVQPAFQAQHRLKVVLSALGLEAVEKPEAQLGGGERKSLRLGRARSHSLKRGGAAQTFGESRHGRSLEQRRHRQLDSECLANSERSA